MGTAQKRHLGCFGYPGVALSGIGQSSKTPEQLNLSNSAVTGAVAWKAMT
jgi:hypothetical protein